jgi:hypothetical protein
VTLVEFLTACLVEDEQAARRSAPGPWNYDPRKQWHLPPPAFGVPSPGEEYVSGPTTGVCIAATGPANDPPSMFTAAHIARWDPARVLAEVKAKRFVIETLRSYEPDDEWDTEPDMGKRSNNAAGAVRRLAQQFAGRPGWDEAWRTPAD